MNSLAPLIIVDFDGVFNPQAQMPVDAVWDDMTDSFFIEDSGAAISITYSPTVINFFNQFSHQTEIIWCSTWFANTEAIGQAMGLPVWPWIKVPTTERKKDWWKADVINSRIEQQRPILWIDDEIPQYPNSEEQKMIVSSDGLVTAIIPKLYVGITPRHIQEIQEFIKKYA